MENTVLDKYPAIQAIFAIANKGILQFVARQKEKRRKVTGRRHGGENEPVMSAEKDRCTYGGLYEQCSILADSRNVRQSHMSCFAIIAVHVSVYVSLNSHGFLCTACCSVAWALTPMETE